MLPEEVLTTRSINTKEHHIQSAKNKKTWKKKVTAKMSLAKHGSATDLQLKSYLVLGSIFWITVMLIGTFRVIIISYFESKFRLFGKITRRYDFSDVDLSPKLQGVR